MAPDVPPSLVTPTPLPFKKESQFFSASLKHYPIAIAIVEIGDGFGKKKPPNYIPWQAKFKHKVLNIAFASTVEPRVTIYSMMIKSHSWCFDNFARHLVGDKRIYWLEIINAFIKIKFLFDHSPNAPCIEEDISWIHIIYFSKLTTRWVSCWHNSSLQNAS